jgi:hypothetical protein
MLEEVCRPLDELRELDFVFYDKDFLGHRERRPGGIAPAWRRHCCPRDHPTGCSTSDDCRPKDFEIVDTIRIRFSA